MDEFTNQTHLNATGDSSATTIAKAAKIKSIHSTTDNGLASQIRCHHCKSHVIIRSVNSIDLLDLNGKRHFCDDADRIRHEENCVIEIQKFIEYYNRKELSGFQEELNIP